MNISSGTLSCFILYSFLINYNYLENISTLSMRYEKTKMAINYVGLRNALILTDVLFRG